MKLDRNINADGLGKYALILLRNMPNEPKARADITLALGTLREAGMLDWGEAETEREFFLIRLKDKFSQPALIAYAEAASEEARVAPDAGISSGLIEYADDVLRMAGRAGRYSKFCKLPD